MSPGASKPGPILTRVRALENRIACEITFPRIDGYRYELPGERLTAKFSKQSQLKLTTANVPTKVENAPIVGQSVTGANQPYDKLKRALRAEIDGAAWSTLYTTTSRPFNRP